MMDELNSGFYRIPQLRRALPLLTAIDLIKVTSGHYQSGGRGPDDSTSLF